MHPFARMCSLKCGQCQLVTRHVIIDDSRLYLLPYVQFTTSYEFSVCLAPAVFRMTRSSGWPARTQYVEHTLQRPLATSQQLAKLLVVLLACRSVLRLWNRQSAEGVGKRRYMFAA